MYDSKIYIIFLLTNLVYFHLKIMYFSKNTVYIVYIQFTDWKNLFFHPQSSAGNPYGPG